MSVRVRDNLAQVLSQQGTHYLKRHRLSFFRRPAVYRFASKQFTGVGRAIREIDRVRRKLESESYGCRGEGIEWLYFNFQPSIRVKVVAERTQTACLAI